MVNFFQDERSSRISPICGEMQSTFAEPVKAGKEEVKEAWQRAKSANVRNPLDGLGVRGCLNGSSSA